MAVARLSEVVNEPASLALALQLLQQGKFAEAERILLALPDGGADPQLHYLIGVARLRQGRFAEGAQSFARARAMAPAQAQPAFGYGEAMAGLGRDAEAAQAYQAVLALNPDFSDARFELGNACHRMGQLAAAEQAFRELLFRVPDHVPARLALGGVLIDAKRPLEAEQPLREGLAMAAPDRLKAALHTNLGLALRRQRKDQEAMDNYDRAMALDPGQAGLAVHRAEALQNLERYDEALAVYGAALAQEPENPELHRRTNDLFYRLNRSDEYLKSYDRAPQSRALKLGKAFLLSQEKRGSEALEIYRQLLQHDARDQAAILGAAGALTTLKRAGEAVALIEPLLAQGEDAALLVRAAEAALQCNDPQKAEHFCRRALVLAPYDQLCLANIGLAWRMMGDEREAVLNRYDDFVRIFDLEPPEGFVSMADFNAELCVYLDRLHPRTREYIDQSLRGGTQTPDHIFGAGHGLIDRLEVRIAQAVQDYIGAMRPAESHPLASRRRNTFDYAGSWSSRLTNCGFHVNHVHPAGWISSCYYVGVPAVVEDAQNKQGWIKFGEPAHDVALADPVRRAVQPVPGRLVLFPSYMWHGTIPFRVDGVRTTIAFDVVPKS